MFYLVPFVLAFEVPHDRSLNAGWGHTCVSLGKNNFQCWGNNNFNQLGLGDNLIRNVPTRISIGSEAEVLGMSFKASSSCVLFDNGRVKCWGWNDSGQAGLEFSGISVLGPPTKLRYVDLGKDLRAKNIFSGGTHVCAVFENGTLKCWGSNSYGKLGLGDFKDRGKEPGTMGESLPFVDLGLGKKVKRGCAGLRHSCVVLEGGALKCWGDGTSGQIGSGSTLSIGKNSNEMGDNLRPVDLGKGIEALDLSCGYSHTCIRVSSGSVKCFGENNMGQLGLGHTMNWGVKKEHMGESLLNLDLPTGFEVKNIGCGPYHCCVLMENGGIKCWGLNDQGQLGLGDRRIRGIFKNDMGDDLPYLDLGYLYKAKDFAIGYRHSCAFLSNLSLKCWGENTDGQLGNGTYISVGGLPGEMGDKLPAVVFAGE